MTATLKHVANQYILIVDESPINGQWYYDKINEAIVKAHHIKYDYNLYPKLWRIIAAQNLDGVKTIRILLSKKTMFTKVGEYKKLFKKLIDTEVEVTEEENYWVVRL